MEALLQTDHYMRIYRKTMDNHIPFIVHMELTYRCNLNCVHCYCVRDREKKELTYNEIRHILDELADAGGLYIIFTGGEIFLRDDFFNIARYSRKKGFALRLFTNGTFINEEAADNIKEISPLSVEMSLYAAEAELHDRVTGVRGSYDKTIHAFKLLRNRGIRTKVKTIIMNLNADQLDKLKRLAEKLGSDIVYDFVIAPKDDGSKDPLSMRLNEEDVYKLIKSSGNSSVFKPLEEVNDDTFMCSVGMNNFSVSPYGDVYPCLGIKKLAGNLKEQPLKDILDSKIISMARETTVSSLWSCRKCSLASFCNRCPGLALLEYGDLLGPSPADCMTARVRKRLYIE